MYFFLNFNTYIIYLQKYFLFGVEFQTVIAYMYTTKYILFPGFFSPRYNNIKKK